MTSKRTRHRGLHYVNPAFPDSFPDPFVLKYCGEYYAYCTGHWTDGRIFGVLRSRDLINWTVVGGAMAEPNEPAPFYWAPEVTYWNGTFYLYYSFGNEEFMHLRVATSTQPDGGFTDAGVRLTDEDFAIDAHVFTDDSGQRFLFYATDFLEHSHIGTGIVVDRMVDWHRLARQSKPVVRAMYDWQVYDPARKEKGGVRWHTVEGPFVLTRKGRFFMMFSGGNWQNPSYGVSFALAGDIDSPNEWRQFSDGRNVMPILRTDPENQVGPGHNSVIRGPDNRETYCIYHYWHEGSRVLGVNRMDFAGNRIFVEEKPYLPKLLPLQPSVRFDLTPDNWDSTGSWDISENTAASRDSAPSEIESDVLPANFVCEFSFQISKNPTRGKFEIQLKSDTAVVASLAFTVRDDLAFYEWSDGEARQGEEPLGLGSVFRLDVLHLVRIEVSGPRLHVSLDETFLSVVRTLAQAPDRIAFLTDGCQASLYGFALTEGFEDLFVQKARTADLADGWEIPTKSGEAGIHDRQLVFSNSEEHEALLCKGEAYENFDFLANIRLTGSIGHGSAYGFFVTTTSGNSVLRYGFIESNGLFYLSDQNDSISVELPHDYNPRSFSQFRFRKRGPELHLDLEGRPLGVWSLEGKARVGFFNCKTGLALDMVRLTAVDN